MISFAVALTLLQIFDGWTTYQIIKKGGHEKNKLIRFLMERVGVYEALLMAKTGAVALVWLLYFLPTPDALTGALQGLGMVGLTAWYFVVSKNNWKVLRGL